MKQDRVDEVSPKKQSISHCVLPFCPTPHAVPRSPSYLFLLSHGNKKQIMLKMEYDNFTVLSLYKSMGFIQEKHLYQFYLNEGHSWCSLFRRLITRMMERYPSLFQIFPVNVEEVSTCGEYALVFASRSSITATVLQSLGPGHPQWPRCT